MVPKNRTKWKTKITRCCIRTRAIRQSWAQATTHNQITSRSEDRNSRAQAAWTSRWVPPPTWTLSHHLLLAPSQYRPSTRTATDSLTSTTAKTSRMERQKSGMWCISARTLEPARVEATQTRRQIFRTYLPFQKTILKRCRMWHRDSLLEAKFRSTVTHTVGTKGT